MATVTLDNGDNLWEVFQSGNPAESNVINALGGADLIVSGLQNDTIHGGDGADQLFGISGNDVINGDGGDDVLDGGAGSDTLTGGAGLDAYILEFRGDEPGHDIIIDNDGALAVGGQFIGASGPTGSYGAPLAGTATVVAGQTNVYQLSVSYTFNDTPKTQTIFFRWSGSGDLTMWSNDDINDPQFPLSESVYTAVIKNYINGSFGITLGSLPTPPGGGGGTPTPQPQPQPQPDVASPTPGNDSLTGTSGADTILGQAGDDTLSGGAGNDFLNGNQGADNVHGNTGDDNVRGGKDNDTVQGGDGNDSVFGDLGLDSVIGGVGNDLIRGGKEADTINGGEGADTIGGDLGNDLLNGGNGADVFLFGNGSGQDTIQSFGTDDVLRFEANLNGGTVDTFLELSSHITIGTDTVIDLGGGNSVTLVGVTSLTDADVEFV